MALSPSDRALVVEELDREPTAAEEALFENLWSEHCAYRSSRPLLSAFDSTGEQVVVGPGDDAAVVAVPVDGDEDDGGGATEKDRDGGEDTDDGSASGPYLAIGIESHNHPSYVDPYDGAATGVGGIVRDVLSMGAYPIALVDSLYFGGFDREHSRYLFEGVVEGIADYGNAIGVPTVGGSVAFHDGYRGNPLVNVACVGLLDADRLVTAAATDPGDRLVLVGNATGRDGLGGAAFASEDLDEDAATEDRPAVQVGDPYTEKLLIECNEALIDEDLPGAARDLGAAGLGGATTEMVAKGGRGAEIDLEAVHQREPGMSALEILLAESQERICYAIAPEDVDRVRALADRFELGSSVIGTVTDGNYVCRFEGETVVDVPARVLAEGAPVNDLEREPPAEPRPDRPDIAVETAFEDVLADPSTASKEWVYRQYDHEVGVRTARPPGDDAAVLALREADTGLALSAGAEPGWTAAAPYDGARAVALENATNLAAKGARPLAAVDCLNGGNPEKPDVYGGFAAVVDGLATMCETLSVPVVGGNVSLYNDSRDGPVVPTPTVAMVGTGPIAPPPAHAHGDGDGDGDSDGDGDLLLVGAREPGRHRVGGSAYLAAAGGTDRFPPLPDAPKAVVTALGAVARRADSLAVHDVSHGGLAVTLAELVGDAGVEVALDDPLALFDEGPGRAVVETTAPDAVRAAFDGVTPVRRIGHTTENGTLDLRVDGRRLRYDRERIAELRGVIARELD